MVPGQDHGDFQTGRVFHRGLGKIRLTWVTTRWRDEDNLSVELPAGVKFVKFYSVLHARGKPLRDHFNDSLGAGRRIIISLDTEQQLFTDHLPVSDTQPANDWFPKQMMPSFKSTRSLHVHLIRKANF